jgi:glycosyltransferase involved in cell wall biosynthesis
LHLSSAKSIGGGEKHFAALTRSLAARGHEVCVALPLHSPLRAQLDGLPPQNIFTLPLSSSIDLSSAFSLARLLRERRIDILHAHVARDYPVASLAARRTRTTRLVITRHVLFPLKRIHRLTLSNVSRVIAVSNAAARALQSREIFPAHKIRVVPNGIDVDEHERVARATDRADVRRKLGLRSSFLVGTVGEISPVKGQEDFVRAARIIADDCTRDVEFLIIGEDASRDARHRRKLEALIAELGLGERVRLLGRRSDVAQLLSCLDVFVSASHTEAFGLAIVEAMACGAAVVATATEGAREIISDHTDGIIVPIGDARALASATKTLIEDEGRRTSIATRARETARRRWSLERMVEMTEQVYREALEES